MYAGKRAKVTAIRYVNIIAEFDEDLRCLCYSLPGDEYLKMLTVAGW